MAAFSRGSVLAVRSCSSSVFTTSFRSSLNSLARDTIHRSIPSVRPFSQCIPQLARLHQKKPPKAIARQLQQMKQELQDRKTAQAEAARKREERRYQLLEEEAEENMLRADIAVPRTREPDPRHTQQDSSGPLPLKQYDPSSIKQPSLDSPQTFETPADRETKQAILELMSRGEETILYRAPRRRWHLGVATFVAAGLTSILVVLLAITLNQCFEESSMWYLALLQLSAAICTFLAIMAMRRRAKYVHQITLVPKTYGQTSIIELRVRGTSYVPLMLKTETAPLWEIRTNRPVQDCEAWRPVVPQKDIREFESLLQPFVWTGHTVSGIWTEIKLIVWASHGRQLTSLWTMEGNTGALAAWNVDARGQFWRGPEAFDYLIKVDESAKKNFMVR